MKKILSLMVIFSLVTAPLYALPAPIEKLKGGTVQILKSPLDLKTYATDEMKTSKYKPFGLVGGLVKGTFHMIDHVGKGVIDIATFPLDLTK